MVNKESEEEHRDDAEDEHHDEVGRPPVKRPLLQHPAVLVGEDHVEEEVEAEVAKEKEGGEQSPHLELAHYQVRIEVELERREQVELSRSRSGHCNDIFYPVFTTDGGLVSREVSFHANQFILPKSTKIDR